MSLKYEQPFLTLFVYISKWLKFQVAFKLSKKPTSKYNDFKPFQTMTFYIKKKFKNTLKKEFKNEFKKKV